MSLLFPFKNSIAQLMDGDKVEHILDQSVPSVNFITLFYSMTYCYFFILSVQCVVLLP